MLEAKMPNNEEDNDPRFTSVGSMIKYYRELKNISVTDVSEKTMIPEKYIHALENDQKNITPSLVHMFSYIKQYSNLLGLDGNSLVELYKKQINISDNCQNASISSNIHNDDELKNLDRDKNMSEDIVSSPESAIEVENSISEHNKSKLADIKNIINQQSGSANKSPKADEIQIPSRVDARTLQSKLRDKKQVYQSNGNGNGKQPESLSSLVNKSENKQDTTIKENLPKEVELAKDQAERILIQAKRDADKMFREAQDFSRQIKYESNKTISDTRKYVEYMLSTAEKIIEKRLMEVKMGRAALKKVDKADVDKKETISENKNKID